MAEERRCVGSWEQQNYDDDYLSAVNSGTNDSQHEDSHENVSYERVFIRPRASLSRLRTQKLAPVLAAVGYFLSFALARLLRAKNLISHAFAFHLRLSVNEIYLDEVKLAVK